jgi:hypothetical protein
MVQTMIIHIRDRHFGFQELDISLLGWIRLKLTGTVYAFHARKEGWTEQFPFYIVKCDRCGCYFLDYPQGYSEYFLCPLCDLANPRGEKAGQEIRRA